MKKKLVAAMLISVTSLALIAGCGAKAGTSTGQEAASAAEAATIVGSWEYESGGYTYNFNADGTGSYDVGDTVMPFTYEDKGDTVYIIYDGDTAGSDSAYRIEGNTLIIKDSLDNDVKYNKK